MDKIYKRINWENLPSEKTPIDETNLNKMDKAIDDLDDRVVALSNNSGSGGADISLANLSGWTHKEEMEDEDVVFLFNWSGSDGNGTLILDALGKEVDRISVPQGDVSYTIKAKDIGPAGDHNLKLSLIDSSGKSRIVPLSFKIRSNDTWAKAKDEKVVELLQKHYSGEINIYDYWGVGEIRRVRLDSANGYSIMDKNDEAHNIPAQQSQETDLILANIGYSGYLSSDNGQPTAFVVCSRNPLTGNLLYPRIPLVLENNYNNLIQNGSVKITDRLWRDCYNTSVGFELDGIRAWLNWAYYNSIPEYLRNNIKSVTYNYAYANKGTKAVSGDKVFLPSAINLAPNIQNLSIQDDNVTWKFFLDLYESGAYSTKTCFSLTDNKEFITTRTTPLTSLSPAYYHVFLRWMLNNKKEYEWLIAASNPNNGSPSFGVMPAFCI